MNRVNNKVTVKEILIDKYEKFKESNWYRVPEILKKQIYNLVKKSLDCGDVTKVPFTCKSKFCNSCGRVYTLKWAENQQKNMLRVGYKHRVFTMPDDLRNYF